MISIFAFFFLINFGSSFRRAPRLNHRKRVSDDYTTACDLCQNLNSALIRYEDWGYTNDQIQASLLSNCNLFTGKSLEVCNYIADTYFPVFLYLGKQGVSALSSCTKMGYCSDLD